MKHEKEFHRRYCFITLTYDDDHLPKGLVKKDLQDFWKRFRKNRKEKIKYLACGEYGETTGRPHYHAIVFGWSPDDPVRLGKVVISKELTETWQKGQCAIGSVTDKSIYYVTGYLLKGGETPDGCQKPYIAASQGLGLAFAEQYREDVYDGTLITDGKQCGVPMYYRRKLGIDKQKYSRRSIEQEQKVKQELRKRNPDVVNEAKRSRAQAVKDVQAMHRIAKRNKI